jgi:putative DNA methylase
VTNYRKKLIEVALPLEAINKEAAREKSIRHGHPSTLHLWWARRPLAACRAVLFASLVDDPSAWPERFPTEEAQGVERLRIFAIIEELVKWENSNDERVINAAKAEIARSLAWARGEKAPSKPDQVQAYLTEHAPPVYDPFCGGGSIPLEAQRLGLKAHASDLNPVAVLITKALIEIPPKFAGRAPVNPESSQKLSNTGSWRGAAGLAEDILYYGRWMRDEAQKRIGHLYPKVKITADMVNERPELKPFAEQDLTVIAWLWARTVASPNPAAKGAHVPLVRSFWLSTKPGNIAWLEPMIDARNMTFELKVRTGKGEPRKGTVGKKGDECLLTGSPITREYTRNEGMAGRMGVRLIAIVAKGPRGRIFLSPDKNHERIALAVSPPPGVPNTTIVGDLRYLTPVSFGMTRHRDLFANRQLVAITTFCSLVADVKAKVTHDKGDASYADALTTYCALAVTKAVDLASTICHWQPNPQHLKIAPTFSRHALAISWDFAEGNPFSDSSGNFFRQWELVAEAVARLGSHGDGIVKQLDARSAGSDGMRVLFSTDPPYYDNIPYADLSDFFYIWLRVCLQKTYPELLGTLLVPKAEELVADQFRHGGKDGARSFFENGIRQVFQRMRKTADERCPTTIYYAFKQAEEDDGYLGANTSNSSRASTGWETFLQGLIDAGWELVGTWPMRTERPGRQRESGSNALASSIILVCRPRTEDAASASRRELLAALKRELPSALRHLQKGNIAPVDLAQAAIGPGMAVFSRYSKVLETDGSPMGVRTALALINQSLDEVLAEQEGEFDVDTRWSVAWFDQHGFSDGPYGSAETLSTAKNTSVSGMIEAGIVAARSGKVRLLRREELESDWDPATDRRFTIWEATHHLVRALEENGEQGSASLIARLGGERAERARDLSYRLYTICERRKWAKDALPYNALVQAWPEASRLAAQVSVPRQTEQQELI